MGAQKAGQRVEVQPHDAVPEHDQPPASQLRRQVGRVSDSQLTSVRLKDLPARRLGAALIPSYWVLLANFL